MHRAIRIVAVWIFACLLLSLPFIEAKELTGGFAVIQVNSLEEAIEWSKRFRQIVGEGETEIVQVFGPADFGAA